MKKKLRDTNLTQDDYYMGMAFQVATRSRDPRGQYGSVIVDAQQRVIITGYSDYFDFIDMPDDVDLLDHVIHAEEMALSRCVGVPFDLIQHATIYTTAIPCFNCVKNIYAHKIKKIIYGPQHSHLHTVEEWQRTKELTRSLKYTLERYTGNLNWMRERLLFMEENSPEVFQPGLPLPL